MFDLELYLFLKVVAYFCTGIIISCSFLYFTIPTLNKENYSLLFSIVLYWPILIPIYLILYVSKYWLKRVEEWRSKRIDEIKNK